MKLWLRPVQALFGDSDNESSCLTVEPFFLRKTDSVPVATAIVQTGEDSDSPKARYVLVLNGRTGKLQLLQAEGLPGQEENLG